MVCWWLLPVSVAAVLNVHDGCSIDRCSEMIVEVDAYGELQDQRK